MKIYILLTHTGTVFSRTIKVFTKEPYTHVSIAFDVELNEVYSFGRKKTNNPLIAGFVREYTDKGVFKKYINTSCAILELEMTLEQYNNLRIIMESFIEDKNKYKYNLIGLVGIVTGYKIERKNAYFCSHFVAAVLEKSGMKLFNKKPVFVTPYDFRTCKFLNLIYSGKLNDYKKFINSVIDAEKEISTSICK